MSSSITSAIVAAAVSLVVAFGMMFVGGQHVAAPSAGSTTQTNLDSYAPSSATAFVGPYGVESDHGFFDAAGGVSSLLGSLAFGSNSSYAGYGFQGTAGTCVNAASSTLFAVKSPFAATSTASVIINIGGNATTSSLEIGTSTVPQGSAGTTALVNSSNGIASTSVFWAISGQTAANDAPGMIAATANIRVTVPPAQYVVGYSTSTATGAGAAQYSPNFSTCSYKILWND